MTTPPSLLDEVLPRFDAREVHDVLVPVAPHVAFAAAKAVTIREVRLLMPLMALRTLPRLVARRPRFTPSLSRPVLDEFVGVGFVPLGERPGESVAIGAIGRFWSLAGNEPVPLEGREDFVAFAERGYAKAALSFVVLPEGGGARVVTETRIAGTSPDATRAFRRYWLAIRLGSGAIRRSWLAAIRRRALRAV